MMEDKHRILFYKFCFFITVVAASSYLYYGMLWQDKYLDMRQNYSYLKARYYKGIARKYYFSKIDETRLKAELDDQEETIINNAKMYCEKLLDYQFILGVYHHKDYYCVWTKNRSEWTLTEAHEQVHAMIEQDDWCGNEGCRVHFCGEEE